MTPERDAELRSRILDLVSAYWEEAHPQEPFEPGRTTVNVAGKVVDTSELRNLVDASLDLWLTTGRYAERFEREFAAAEQARQRSVQEREAAQASRLFLGGSGGAPLREAAAEIAAVPASAEAAAEKPTIASARRLNTTTSMVRPVSVWRTVIFSSMAAIILLGAPGVHPIRTP